MEEKKATTGARNSEAQKNKRRAEQWRKNAAGWKEQ
jgi:hypothetical protein